VVFKLSPATGGKWKETVLYAFTGGSDGSAPQAGLVFDKVGTLFGTTWRGGNLAACGFGCGTVLALTPESTGPWKETVLHAFAGNDGDLPHSTLVIDAAGNLYGTTLGGGIPGSGVAFEIIP
jgi:hypothetical protein